MLIEKKTKKAALTVVEKKETVKVIKMEQEMPLLKLPKQPKQKAKRLSPPADQFNTGYIKVKKHDPL